MPTGVYNSTKRHKFQKGETVKEKNYNWKGGKRIGSDGYVMILRPNHPFHGFGNYVREHREVMEKHLGRYLKPEERIHHINHNKTDNRLENLRLYNTNGHHMKQEHPNTGFQKGHPFFGDLLKPNYFQKGHPKPKNAYTFPKRHPHYFSSKVSKTF
jgi:hypothetical protein